MRVRHPLLTFALAAALAPAAARAATYDDGHGVHAEVTADKVALGNDLVERTWTRAQLTSTIADLRDGGRTWSAAGPDFTLRIAGQDIPSSAFAVSEATVTDLARGGLRLTLRLTHTVPALTAVRTIEAYPGVAGFRSQTTLFSPVPLVLSGATLDEID